MIIIEGAGIAGLTLANCLNKLRRRYLLVEKASQLHAAGAGIALQNNGLAILEALDLNNDLTGCELEHMEMVSQYQRQKLNKAVGWQAKMVHRQELQRALLKNIARDNILLGCTIEQAEQQDQGVNITLSNGQQYEADLLVVASGIHGNTHQKANIQQSNQWCWRTVIHSEHSHTTGGEYWFGDYRIGVAPIGNQQFYLYQVLKNGSEQDEQARLEFWQSPKVKDLFPWLDVTDANWLSHPLSQRQIHWGKNRIIAIGDAAHALTPNMGQGAVLAMEDAYQLAMLLADTHVEQLLPALIRARHQRVAKVQKQSLAIGNLAHWQNPIAVYVRDALMKLVPAEKMVRQQIAWMQQFIAQMQPLTPTQMEHPS